MEKRANRLDRAFNPHCVAVVGDKKQGGYSWLKSMSTFKGKVYSVQIDENELPGIQELGVPNYRSLLDIPEPVDYVVCAVPRAVSPRIVQDCIVKGVGGVTLFTSGFAETGTEEGIRLQKAITEMARGSGLVLIGPNCMGIFNPSLGVRHSVDQYAGDGGPVGFISQSGTHATYFSLVGAVNGVRVSKSVSYGNAVVLDSPDYLEYLARDEATRVIGMYIEGVKDGQRFFRTLKEVAYTKPVLIWKGGMTQAGTRATASHTGQLAESATVWEVVMRQCGAIKVDSLEEMVDAIKALLYIKPTIGSRVGLIAMTGGQSVVITDTFARAGLEVPLLTEKSYQQFATWFTVVGGSYKNPLDVSSNFFRVPDPLGNLLKMLNTLDADENVDIVALELSVAFMAGIQQKDPGFLSKMSQVLADFKQRSAKAFLVILIAGHREAWAIDIREHLMKAGIPGYPSFDRGARALRKAVDYYRFLEAS